ncbi:unnamed protein product [Cuscuta campestris]|uniref:Lipoyl-binding domain-containing protein n=1 Tax=Cuscuta campestris TaxID=132261 RepID=A0A484LYW6_9ASTE|nr:unnamed protein product [Cuscuta campestris]
MDSSAVLRSFHNPIGSSNVKSFLDMPSVVPMKSVAFSNLSRLAFAGNRLVVSSAKASGTNASEDMIGAAILTEGKQTFSNEKKPLSRVTFPEGFEDLITEVCDSTQIAELKFKAGGFEMHVKRKVEGTTVPTPVFSPTPPPTPSEPVVDTLPAASSPSSPSGESSPFVNISPEKSAMLAALEASGIRGYVLVLSPAVGFFQRSRTLKGNVQSPAWKEGDIIKENQSIGLIAQFESEVLVTANVSGKVLKILYDDGEAVGYGDPLIAVLPW